MSFAHSWAYSMVYYNLEVDCNSEGRYSIISSLRSTVLAAVSYQPNLICDTLFELGAWYKLQQDENVLWHHQFFFTFLTAWSKILTYIRSWMQLLWKKLFNSACTLYLSMFVLFLKLRFINCTSCLHKKYIRIQYSWYILKFLRQRNFLDPPLTFLY